MTPDRIHVSAAPGLRWRNRTAVNALTEGLLALGYHDDGPHVIEGMPAWQLRLFSHVRDSAYAVVMNSTAEGTWVDLYCRYGAGCATYSFTASNTTSRKVGLLDKPPGVLSKTFPGFTLPRLHAAFLKSRLKEKLAPVRVGGCATSMEEAWAHEMDWRNQRGGPTPQEIAKVAALPPGGSKRKVPQDPFQELSSLLHAVRLKPTHRRMPPKSLTGAVQTGDVELVKQFLAAGFSADEKTVGFGSPLEPAASRGDLAMVELLLEAGASPHQKGLIFSPLINAAKRGHATVVDRLVRAGVDLAKEGPDALLAAAESGHVEVLRALLSAGVSEAKAGKALQAAAADGQFLAAKFLVEAGVNPQRHAQYATDLQGRKCRAPLLPATLARQGGFRLLADYLAGKSVDEAALVAATPASKDPGAELGVALREFEQATEGERLEGVYRQGAVLRILELLRSGEMGWRLNYSDSKRRYPLRMAAANGDVEVVKEMLKASAAAGEPPPQAFEPLEEAACNGHREIVRLLLEAGAAPNPNAVGASLLFGAVEWGDPELVKLLLDAGAEPDVKDDNGKTLFAINAGLHDKTIKTMLKQASQQRKGGMTTAGSGLLCKRRKKMVNVVTARGVQDFKAFFGQPEWAVAIVRAPAASVAKELAAITRCPRWDQDVARQTLESARSCIFVAQLRGSDWSLVLRALGWIGMKELEQLPTETAELSRRLKTRAFVYMAEDTSGCEGYELFENGVRLERADWDGRLKFESKLRRTKPRFNEAFPDPVFADEGIYLPTCWFEDDGKEIKLGLEGLVPGDVVRLDRIVLKE